jgi:hypothetical protein
MRRALLLFLLAWPAIAAQAADSIAFWDTPQRGSNCFNEKPPDAEYFRALRGYGATWVRLTFSKWKSARGRDFLFGNLDRYQALDPEDLATLRMVLDHAHTAGLKVVVVPLSLPGARWIQMNDNVFDDRLWSDWQYWDQSAAAWRDLAAALADHPAIVAYNLVNEPVPERKGGLAEHSPPDIMRSWYEKARGTPRDLPRFYAKLIDAVRESDRRTPIMLDAGYYAAAEGLSYWDGAPHADARLLYAFHMYVPWVATSSSNLKRAEPYRYPGVVPFVGRETRWDAERVAAHLQQPFDWARAHGVPSSRLVAGEFGCMRRWPDCPRYLDDVLTVLEKHRAHWAFYSFREAWDGMDYELGAGKLPWQYWQAADKGQPFELERGPNPVFEPILRRLRGAR